MSPNQKPEEEEDDDAPGAPPEADTVALRALAAAALLKRLELEQRKAPPADFAALTKWIEQNGLHASLGPAAFQLFDAAPGTWAVEDLEAVAWAAEELQMLVWALGRVDTPTLFARANPGQLMGGLPLSGPAEPFSLAAKLRTLESMEVQRALYDTLHAAARSEAWARGVAADPTLATEDDELDDVLGGLELEGFDFERLTREVGAQAAAVQGLRGLSRQLVDDLFEEGSPHRALAFEGRKLEALDDEALAIFLATAQLRGEALAWLTEGDEWDFGDDEA